MSELVEVILLGIVQGLAEFIPVSSSGHLVLVPEFLGFPTRGLAFDVALHLGTLAAVVLYLRAELVAIVRALLGRDQRPEALVYRRVGLLAVAATVPIAIVGLLVREPLEAIFDAPVWAAAALLATGTILLAAEWVRDRRVRAPVTTGGGAAQGADDDGPLVLGVDASDPAGRSLRGLDLGRALLVGAGQCVALLPGVSRSGTTIAAGMAAGLTREAATRFSFLLSLPALAGATVLSLPDMLGSSDPDALPPTMLLVGVVAAFLSGSAAIRVLIAFVSRERLTGFAVYCFVVGAASLGFLLLA